MERDEEVEVTRDPGKAARLIMDFPDPIQMFNFWRDVVHPAMRVGIPDTPYSLLPMEYDPGAKLPRMYREYQVDETNYEDVRKPQIGEPVLLVDVDDEDESMPYQSSVVAIYSSNYDAIEGTTGEAVLWDIEVKDVEGIIFQVYWSERNQAWFADGTKPEDHGLVSDG